MPATTTTATLVARLVADTSAFVGGINAATASMMSSTAKMQAMGTEAMAVGKKISTHIGLPIVAIGVLAIRSAMRYEEGMTKIATLTTATTAEVNAMSDAMMRFGAETGVAPQKLQQAMFLLASSGLSAGTAIEALHMSAQAGALGLGDVGTVADAVSSAINAYGEANLSARDATNALINAVKLGKMKPEELAGSLGRVIPVASAMGVSFQEVVADMASLTQIGMSSSIAATSLRATLMAIAKPTNDAAKAMALLGLSTTDVRESVASKGLLPTLQMLSEKVGGNTSEMVKMFPEARALAGILAWTGANAKNSAKNFDELKKNADQLSKGMEYLAKQPGFQVKQAMAGFQTSLLKVGDTILPIAAKVAAGFSAIFGAVSKLPGPVMEVVVAVGMFAAILGPLTYMIGAAVKAYGALKVAMEMVSAFGAEAITLVNPIMLAAAALGALVVAFTILSPHTEKNTEEIDALTESYRKNAGAIDGTAASTLLATIKKKGLLDELKKVAKALPEGTNAFGLWTQAVNGNKGAQEDLRRALVKSGEVTISYSRDVKENKAATEEWIATGQIMRRGSDLFSSVLGRNRGLWETYTSQVRSANEAHQIIKAEQATGASQMDAFGSSVTSAGVAVNNSGRSLEDLKTAMEGATEAGNALKDAYDAIFGNALSMAEAEVSAAEKVDAVKQSFADSEAGVNAHRSALYAAVRGYNDLSEATVRQTGDADAANAQWQMNITALVQTAAQAGATQADIARLAQALNLPTDVQTAISAPGANAAKILIDNLHTVIDQVPKNPTITPQVDDGPALMKMYNFNKQVAGAAERWNIYWNAVNKGFPAGMGPLGPTLVPPTGATLPSGLRAAGGIVTKREHSIVGEAGPEAIIPLGASPAARANRQTVMDALGIGASALAVPTSGSTQTINNTFQIDVSVAPGANGSAAAQALVDALVSWQRRNGALPLTVQG